MAKASLDSYLDNDSFLELVAEYQDLNEYDLKRKIADEVYGNIASAHGKPHEVMSYLSEARSLINVMQYILDKRDDPFA